jgi:PiT family inorganic phosphate transporter
VANSDVFVWLMLAALLAGAIWLNIATASRAPVSTTHSIVGGVLGAGIRPVAGRVANWDHGSIAASWIISPMGVVSPRPLFHQAPDSLPPGCHGRGAPRRSLLVAGMAWAFTTYLMLKGVRAVLKVGFVESALAGGVVALLTYVVVRRASPGSRTPARRTTRRVSM